jgi:glycosyltransferase involved in cell wall biosynthesis
MTAKTNDIICLAFPAWEGNYLKSTVQLMKELAKTNRVLYVDYAYTWKDFINSLLGKSFASWQRMLGLEPRLRTETLENGADIYILTVPPVIPTNFIKNPWLFDKINAFNAYFMGKTIKKAQFSLGMLPPSVSFTSGSRLTVINAFNPIFGVHLGGKLGEKHLIYYCYDEINAANWAKRHGSRLENRFINMVDTVVVTSQGLLDKKSKLHDNCHLVKNGVDFELFASEKTQTLSYPIPNAGQYEKTIGYLGSVDERLDYDLIENVITRTPQYQYIFVGRITTVAYENRLKKYPNVILVGSQPPSSLPTWVQKYDVCWIPFIKNELTAGIYPLKINEYLAAGKPVVSTPFSDLSDFTAVISIAENAEKMVACFQLDNQNATLRRDFAAQNTWGARANDLGKLIANM